MRITGLWMMVGGVALALLSLLMPTSVSNDPVLASIGSLPVASALNLGLLQNQQLAFMAGLALTVAGSIFVGAGAIVDAVRDVRAEGTSAAYPGHPPTIVDSPRDTQVRASGVADGLRVASDRDRAANMIAAGVCALIVISLVVFSIL